MAVDDSKNWADMVEDDGGEETFESPMGDKVERKVLDDGTMVETEIVSKDGGKFKVTKYIKSSKKERKIFTSALERQKRWVKFGKAKDNSPELTVAAEPVKLELGKKEEMDKTKMESEIQKMVNKVSIAVASGGNASGAYVPPDRKSGGGDAAPGEEGKKTYVAPGRGSGETADSKPQRDDSCTVRITNISEDISEDDLRSLFSTYGHISRSYVAVDRVTRERRGFAFITFKKQEDAANAIRHLDRHPFNHVILNVGWAKPPQQQTQSSS
eukprot:TRINITY_DN7425_c0_g1_i1.p1 TRINITY_DN7425_c0_g1~~TRINITY_DN7425_c0_g1_i1.p1  ORF type:complete len:270 (+),score=72.59 TRINITY_DN7425_c0_g1_i1:45-854(+)